MYLVRHSDDILHFLCSKSTKSIDLFDNFFYFVAFSTNFSPKNRTKLTIYKFDDLVYNTKAVGGTNSTATHNCLYLHAEYQSYDIKRAGINSRLCFFFFQPFSGHFRRHSFGKRRSYRAFSVSLRPIIEQRVKMYNARRKYYSHKQNIRSDTIKFHQMLIINYY